MVVGRGFVCIRPGLPHFLAWELPSPPALLSTSPIGAGLGQVSKCGALFVFADLSFSPHFSTEIPLPPAGSEALKRR